MLLFNRGSAWLIVLIPRRLTNRAILIRFEIGILNIALDKSSFWMAEYFWRRNEEAMA